VSLPHLQLFGISDGLELRVGVVDPCSTAVLIIFVKIKKRGALPLGGGEVQFLCPIIKQAKTLNFIAPGKIKRIRGIAYAVD
jgi:RNA 3'-terminal phosphate cyclase-like protein